MSTFADETAAALDAGQFTVVVWGIGLVVLLLAYYVVRGR